MNIRIIFFLIITGVSLSLSAQTQTWQWVKAGGSSFDNNSVQPPECKIAGCDAYGNVYAVGEVNGSNMKFDTFSSAGSYSLTNTGGSYLLFSYDCSGNMRCYSINLQAGYCKKKTVENRNTLQQNISVNNLYLSI